jgi:hypothetical protein
MNAIYPALKLKRGEVEAVRQSESLVANNITPLFDIARPGEYRLLDKRIEESLTLLHSAQPRISKEFYIDAKDLPLDWRLRGDIHPAYGFAKRIANSGYKPIHCFGFDRDDAYEKAFIQIAAENLTSRIALRLEKEDLKLLPETLDKINGFLGRVHRSPEETHLFFDLGSIASSTEDWHAITKKAHTALFSRGFKKIIFLASSMWDYSRVPPNKITKIPREEIIIWESLRREKIDISYGDYGIIIPSYIDPSQPVSSSPKFRYCTPTCWWVVKGEKPKEGYGQHPRLAKKVMKLDAFRVNDFGWGHDQIRAFSEYQRDTTDSAGTIAIDLCTHLDIADRQVQVVERQVAGISPAA